MFKLSWNFDDYTPRELARKTDKELRTEYSRMRDTLQKRYKRMMKSEYRDTPAAKNYQRYGIPKLSEINDDNTIRRVMAAMATQIHNGSSSIAVQKAKDKALREAIANGLGDIFESTDDIDDIVTNADDIWYQMTFEDRGKMWQWIRAKYDEAFLPASDSVDSQVSETLRSSDKSSVRKMLFGAWHARQLKKSDRLTRNSGKAQSNA